MRTGNPSSQERTSVKRKRRAASRVRVPRRTVTQDALKFVEQVLEKWWKDYVSALDRFLQSASGRNVHDLRVAIRRLSTVFDLIDRFNPDNMVRRARGKLKDELSALSSLRDAHVEMVRMRGFLKERPEMKPFYDLLLDKESRQLKAAKKVGWKQDRKFIQTNYNRAMRRLNARRATSSGESTRKVIEASIDVLFDNLSKRLTKVTPSDYASIHRVRQAVKVHA
jgi:CHAD domain-containing protein